MTSAALPALAPPWRIGVDVGGTFTDVVVVDAHGRSSVIKSPSVPARPAEGVLAALIRTADALETTLPALLGRCGLLVHGSTVATNILVERKGARIGMLCTAGFRDSVQIRRGIRDKAWDHRAPYPPVLVPRHLRRPVGGRIDHRGEEIAAIVEADVAAAADLFRREGVEAVAICLINSFINADHEERAAALLRAHMPDVWVSLSHRVAPVMGEYERSSTAAVDAYVAPAVVGYALDLERRLKAAGLSAPLLFVQSSGGMLSADGVARRPSSLLLSGPAAAVGALALCTGAAGTADLLSMEIGGTSCDVLMVRDGEAESTTSFALAGYHLSLPAIQIHSIGAGGGTIAGVDRGGMLFAGPRGAGAVPGPASYGRGGTEPTVTDAQLVLGRLREGAFAGGLSLDHARAAAAIEDRVAHPLGLSLTDAAAGIVRLVEQSLYHAVDRVSAARGHDPRRFTLVAAGGAGPMHGGRVARLLGARRVLVPRMSGAFCALGMLNTDVQHEAARVMRLPLADGSIPAIADALAGLARAVGATLEAEGFAGPALRLRPQVELKYRGQLGIIRLDMPAGDAPVAALSAAFATRHESLYGHAQDAAAIEVAGVRVVGYGSQPRVVLATLGPGADPPVPAGSRDAWFLDGGYRPTPVYRDVDLCAGDILVGPSLVEAETTTVVVDPGDRLSVDAHGHFVIDLAETAA